MDQPPGGATTEPWSKREYALLAIAVGAGTLAVFIIGGGLVKAAQRRQS